MNSPLPQYPEQPIFHAPPQPRPRTPFPHCAAGVGVWYVAIIVAFGVAELKGATNGYRWLGVLVAGAIVWLLTATAMWGVLRAVPKQIKPWWLILLALPFGWAVYNVISTLVLVVVLFAVSHS